LNIHRISFAVVLALVLALAWRWTASAATTWPTTHDAFVRSDVAPLRDGGAAEALWVMASFQQAQLAQVRLGDRAEMSMRAIPASRGPVTSTRSWATGAA